MRAPTLAEYEGDIDSYDADECLALEALALQNQAGEEA